MTHNNQKKVAAINDISGFGRCSTTVALPIISYMRIQYCPVPTSIFSNHTGYPDYFFDDYTDRMEEYISKWKNLGLEFEGIYSGFLGSMRQIEIVKNFIFDFRTARSVIVVDPVMGDGGIPYATYNESMCSSMRQLVEMADIITPNVTEACILTDTPYKEYGWSYKELIKIAEKLSDIGPGKIVITGINNKSYVGNFVFERGEQPKIIKSRVIGTTRCGTGDIFSAIITADAVNGVDFQKSVRKAAKFVQRCVKISIERDIPEPDGVCFEEILHTLKID